MKKINQDNNPLETEIQRAVLQALKWHKDVAWVYRFNVGAHTLEYPDSSGHIKRRLIRYAFPGCSDILGQMKDGRLLAVEVKREKGYLTPGQQQFLHLVRENNGIAFVARNVQEVVDQLERNK